MQAAIKMLSPSPQLAIYDLRYLKNVRLRHPRPHPLYNALRPSPNYLTEPCIELDSYQSDEIRRGFDVAPDLIAAALPGGEHNPDLQTFSRSPKTSTYSYQVETGNTNLVSCLGRVNVFSSNTGNKLWDHNVGEIDAYPTNIVSSMFTPDIKCVSFVDNGRDNAHTALMLGYSNFVEVFEQPDFNDQDAPLPESKWLQSRKSLLR